MSDMDFLHLTQGARGLLEMKKRHIQCIVSVSNSELPTAIQDTAQHIMKHFEETSRCIKTGLESRFASPGGVRPGA